MSLISACGSPIQVIGKIMLFVQLGTLHVCVQFGVLNNLAVPLLRGTSIIGIFVERDFPMERSIVAIQSRPIATISGYTPPLHPLPVLQTQSDPEISTEDQPEKKSRTTLFQVVRSFAILPNTEPSVSVTTSSCGLIYMALHPNLMRNQMFLPSSKILYALAHVPTLIQLGSFAKNRQH